MKFEAVPAPILAKLALLQEEATRLDKEAERAGDGLRAAQAKIRKPEGLTQKQFEDVQAAYKDLQVEQSKLQSRASAAKDTVDACNRWLAELPEGVRLKPRDVNTAGRTLSGVRDDISRRKAELDLLDAVPVPHPNIEEFVRNHVRALGRPKLEGIESGNLRIYWGDEWPSLIAFLDPEALVRAVLAEVTRIANERLPVAQRRQRMTTLESEIRDLRYFEEKLIEESTEPVERDAAVPARTILGAEFVAPGAEQNAERVA
jgi:hypothetical protein